MTYAQVSTFVWVEMLRREKVTGVELTPETISMWAEYLDADLSLVNQAVDAIRKWVGDGHQLIDFRPEPAGGSSNGSAS